MTLKTGRPVRDMVLSLAALLVPVVILLGVYRYVFAGDSPVRVDVSQTYATAQHDAGYPILVPNTLPAGWTSISSSFTLGSDGSVLRVAYVLPARTGLQLIESNRPVDALLPDELGSDATPGNLETVGDRQWRVYPQARDGNRALVLAEDGRTTIVIGTTTDADLRSFALALH